MQTTGDRADYPTGTAMSGGSTADSSGINGPFTEYNALMRERDALVYHRQMLERKRTELQQSLQKQRSEREECLALFVLSSSDALLRETESDRERRTFGTYGIAHQCVHNSAVLSSWSTPICKGVGATGMKEYHKSFHAHCLEGTLRHTERIHLCYGDLVSFMRTLTTSHLSPMLRRLVVDMPHVNEATMQNINRWEAERRLAFPAIPLNNIQPRLKISFILQSLYSLDVSRSTITNEDLRSLPRSRNLVHLDLSFCRGVADLRLISRIQTLEVVKLSGFQVFMDLRYLCKMPRLKELQLRETGVTDADLRKLSDCHSLVKIHLSECKRLKDVKPLSFIATLELVILSCCTSLTHVSGLGKMPALKAIGLCGACITDVVVGSPSCV